MALFCDAGASDATYHIMWIILNNALDDFGIREVNDVTRTGTSETLLPQHVQIEEKKRKVMNEALHGALRIAGLVRPQSPSTLDDRQSSYVQKKR